MRNFLPALFIILAAAGCLRSASEPIDSPGAAPRNTETFTPSPFPTLPTNTPFIITQPAEVIVTSIVQVVTSTPEPTTAFEAQAQVADASGVESSNTDNEAQPGLEQVQFATETPFQQPVANPAEATQFAQATEIIAAETQRVFNLTLTAQGPVTPLPTFTPTVDPFVTPIFTPTFTNAPVQLGADCVHEVRAGDNLYRLSLRYGVLVSDIARVNGISNIQLIVVGQRLTIPGCGTTGTFPPPTSTNTPDPTQIASGVSTTSSVSGTTTTTTTTQPIVGGTQYTIRQGETLFEIALRYGVTVDQILAANPSITDPNFVLMETTITIPPSQ